MDPRSTIERIHAENIDFGNPRMAVNMANALDQLSREIYTEYIRFLFELVQNADDARASRLMVHVLEGHLVVAHDGDPFTERDVEALCSIGQGTKLSDPNKTGYKGIGFKSVFGRSGKVSVFSQGFQFGFQQGFVHPKWPDAKMPWQTIPIWVEREAYPKEVFDLPDGSWNVVTVLDLPGTEELQTDLGELIGNGEVLLFLRNLERIDVSGAMQLSVARDVKAQEAAFARVGITRNGKPKSEWLIRTFGDIQLDPALRKELAADDKTPDKLKEIERTEITLAAKVKKDRLTQVDKEESLIYTYLPTKVGGFRFPFLVNASFLTNAGREELHEDRRWNEWLLEQAAGHLVAWMAELAATDTYRNDILELLPTSREGGPLADRFHQAFQKAIRTTAFIPNDTGDLLKPHEALIDESGLTKVDFISPEAVLAYINKTKGTQLELRASVSPALRKRERLAQWGVATFALDDLEAFFTDEVFKEHHQPEQNPALMRYLYQEAQGPRREDLGRLLPDLPFIYAKGKVLRSPKRICFPTKADLSEVEKDVKVLHTKVFDAIKEDEVLLKWLERLGVAEVSEVGWLEREVLPTLWQGYIHEGHMELVRTLCRMHERGLLSDIHLQALRDLKLKSKGGAANKSSSLYLGAEYDPVLDLEGLIKEDQILGAEYFEISNVSRASLKSFFVDIGVSDDLYLKRWESVIGWRTANRGSYLTFIDKEYNDGSSNWSYHDGGAVSDPHGFSGFFEISMLDYSTRSSEFSRVLLQRMFSNRIKGVDPKSVDKDIVFLHGYRRNQKRVVWSYPKWHLKKASCYPTVDGQRLKAEYVYVNRPEILVAAGGCLPVLDCEVVPSPDWLQVIPFKRDLSMADCLTVLSKVASGKQDWTGEQIRCLYERMIDLVPDMTSEDEQHVRSWAAAGKLPARNMALRPCHELRWVKLKGASWSGALEGQLYIPKDLKTDEGFEKLLDLMGIPVIDRFEVEPTNARDARDLRMRLEGLVHYLAAGVEGGDAALSNLEEKLSQLNFLSCEGLALSYVAGKEKVMGSDILAHLEGDRVHFVGDWRKPTVRHELAPLLAKALGIPDLASELELMLQLDATELDERLRKLGADPTQVPDEVREQLRGTGTVVLPEALSATVHEMLEKGYTNEQITALLHAGAEGSDGTGPGPSEDDLPREARKEENQLARRLVKERLEQQGFVYTQGDGTNSVVDGVMKDGVEYPLVVKSYQNTSYPLKITPGEWLQLSKERAMCWIHEGGGRLVNLDLEGLLKGNTHFHVQFRTDSFDLDGLAKFAEVFRYVPDVRFELSAPGFKVASSLEEYLFDARSGKKLQEGPDDDAMLG